MESKKFCSEMVFFIRREWAKIIGKYICGGYADVPGFDLGRLFKALRIIDKCNTTTKSVIKKAWGLLHL